ncbi:14270_t:CDS:2 [Funneliformis geosporum]|uniref:14270_t:CDS:1 n=1 Tax=Funneliformis geosporum TaxID=1117311 RepID=A0A9W4SDM2_9GLOM|nr:14270_t:CDS:2 [Funneliformis geosporum]
MALIVSDKKLFTIILFSVFANNDFITTFRDCWKNPWITGTAASSSIRNNWSNTNSFASWLMSLYGGSVGSGSILSFLQSVGAVGLGTAGTFISSSVGAAVGILIGAAGGNMLAKYFNEMDLNEYEQQIFENFIQIEEIAISNDHNMIIALMPALLYNELMLKCFIETFISSSPFLNSKLFKFYFKDDLLKLKSEKEKFNDLLISNFEESRVEKIWIKGEVFGYELDLNDYRPSNGMINLLAEVWYQINTNKDRKSEFFHKVKELSAPIFSPFKGIFGS